MNDEPEPERLPPEVPAAQHEEPIGPPHIPPGAVTPVIHTEAFPESFGSGDGVSEFGEDSDRQFAEWVRNNRKAEEEEFAQERKEDLERTFRAARWADGYRDPPPNRLRRILHRIAVFFSCVMFIASVASAADPYVRIGTNASGTIITHNRRLQILTCAHAVRDVGDTVMFQRGRNPEWLRGKVAAVDTDRDLALIDIPRFDDVTPVAVADETPQQVDVQVIGFGKNHYVARRGTANGLVSSRIGYRTKRFDSDKQRDLLSVSVPGRLRDSGSPVVYEGKIVGIVLSRDKDHTFAVPVEEVNAFLGEQ